MNVDFWASLASSVYGSFIAGGLIELIRPLESMVKIKPKIHPILRKTLFKEKTYKKVSEIELGSYILLLLDQWETGENQGGWGKTLPLYATSLYPEKYPKERQIPTDSVTSTKWPIQALMSIDPSFRYSDFARKTYCYIEKLKDLENSGAYGRMIEKGRTDPHPVFEPSLRHTANSMHMMLILNNNNPNSDIQKSLQYLLENRNQWLLNKESEHHDPAIADISASISAVRETDLGRIYINDIEAAINASLVELVKNLGNQNYWKEAGHPNAELFRTLYILRVCDFGRFYPDIYWRLIENVAELFHKHSNRMPFTSAGEGVGLGNAASLFVLLDDTIRKGYAIKDDIEEWCAVLQSDLITFIVNESFNFDSHKYDTWITWSEILVMTSRCLDFPMPKIREMGDKIGCILSRLNNLDTTRQLMDTLEDIPFIKNVITKIALTRGLISFDQSDNR